MIDTDKLPSIVLDAILNNLGCDDDVTGDARQPYLDQVRQMDAQTAFNCYLTWYGLIGWADNIAQALDRIRAAQ